MWRVALGSVVLGLAVAAGCSDEDEPGARSTTTSTETSTTATSTTVPERPASTTTTALDPATVEGQVEAAYLRSWDVYADAVYNLELDEEALAAVHAEAALEVRRREIERRIGERRASYVRVDHNYEVNVISPVAAHVIDSFVNHHVLIDPETKQPIETDPNETLVVNTQMKLVDGQWRVTLIEKITP